MTQAAGHNAYRPGYSQITHHEWRTAENSAAYLLPTLKAKVKENPSLTLLDVGAGPGTITVSLAKYMPQGHITASDLSDVVLQKGIAHAKQAAVKNITFQAANIYELPFPDASFDIVHAHQVLTHLDAPVQALKELLRVTKPGGVVATRESDLRMWTIYPELPGCKKFHDIMLATHQDLGGSNSAGTQLVSWAMKAGAKREQITATMGTWCYSTPEERAMWGGTFVDRIRNGEVGKKALEMGITTKEELDDVAKDWEKWIQAEDGCFGCMHGEILVTK